MNTEAHKKSSLLSVIVTLLALAVVAQGVLLYRIYSRLNPAATDSAPALAFTPSAQAALPHQKPAAATPRRNPHPQPAAPDPAAQAFDDPFDQFGMVDPFEEVKHMRQQMDNLLGNAAQFFQGAPSISDPWDAFPVKPDLDLHEENDSYVVRMDVPGSDKSKIDLSMQDRTLTVSGSTDETVEKKDGGRLLRSERRHGQFQRSITLPGPVDADKMQAKYENGVLVITIPKSIAGSARHNVPVT